MCGLTGIFDSQEQRRISADLLRRMTDRLSHRGPDGAGEHIAPGIGLGHRRLAIIDIAGGQQPMTDATGRITLVFNGEIYNFRSLAEELQKAGHRFRSQCDTEVILHGWKQWGRDAVARFRGMFAFALWDEEQQTLCLARDHLGKKPLYWTRQPDGLVLFASELKALTPSAGWSRDLDPLAIEDYFAFGYVPDPRSIYQAVRQLPPAHQMIWRRGDAEPKLERYWDVRFRPPHRQSANAAAEELRERLRVATRDRLMSDVPVGAFLSGGVDSSAVVAMMAPLLDRPAQTFSIGFGESSHDESAYAERIAARYGTRHHSRKVDADDFALIDRLAGIYDEPFGDSSAMPTFRVCQLAREQVTVALSGDGGDEVFAGYRRQAVHLRTEAIRRSIAAPLRRLLFGGLAAVTPKADWAPRRLRAKTTWMELAEDSAGAYFQAVSALNDPARRALFSPAFRRSLQGYRASDLLRRHLAQADTDDALQQIQYIDLKTWLPGDILVKVDRASMANSLEVRSPLLDVGLVEWGLNLPLADKVSGSGGKLLLKRAMAPFIDDDLLTRPKQGFSMPLARWFKGPLRERIIALAGSDRLRQSGIVEMATIERMAQQHIGGRADHAVGLWLLLMFDAFLATQSDEGRVDR